MDLPRGKLDSFKIQSTYKKSRGKKILLQKDLNKQLGKTIGRKLPDVMINESIYSRRMRVPPSEVNLLETKVCKSVRCLITLPENMRDMEVHGLEFCHAIKPSYPDLPRKRKGRIVETVYCREGVTFKPYRRPSTMHSNFNSKHNSHKFRKERLKLNKPARFYCTVILLASTLETGKVVYRPLLTIVVLLR